MPTKITNEAAAAMLTALGNLVSGGSLKIYSGTVPATAATALSDQVKLFEDSWSAAAYSSVSNNVMTMDHSQLSAQAVADGDASFYRVETSLGATRWQGTVGTSDANLIVDSVAFTTGGVVTILGWTVTHPLGA